MDRAERVVNGEESNVNDRPPEPEAPHPGMTEYLRGPAAAHSSEVPPEAFIDPRQALPEQWAVGPDGTRMWGRDGAAGLLVVDHDRGILLQHRAMWSHHGGTWGLPGGALDDGEDAVAAALREAREEAAVPADHLALLATRILDLGFWTYTTVLAEATRPFRARITDAESAGLAWVVPAEVGRLKLHPGFAKAWPTLRTIVGPRPTIVVDIANVMGAEPDGWWRDRAGGIRRTLGLCADLAAAGVPASWFERDAALMWPRIVAVLEGAAGRTVGRDADDTAWTHAVGPLEAAGSTGVSRPRVEVVVAPGEGDDTIAELAERFGPGTLVATSDRGLASRIDAVGARAIGARRFRERDPR